MLVTLDAPMPSASFALTSVRILASVTWFSGVSFVRQPTARSKAITIMNCIIVNVRVLFLFICQSSNCMDHWGKKLLHGNADKRGSPEWKDFEAGQTCSPDTVRYSCR